MAHPARTATPGAAPGGESDGRAVADIADIAPDGIGADRYKQNHRVNQLPLERESHMTYQVTLRAGVTRVPGPSKIPPKPAIENRVDAA